MFFKKNKRGVEAGGFSIIAGIIILLISAAVITMVIQHSAKKANEKVKVDLCRVSNEIIFGYEKRVLGVARALTPGPPRVCSTLDKTTKDSEVPTKDYSQNRRGVQEEIRDMIKNCWYMWLEGAQSNMFEKMPGGNGCFTCYIFKSKEEISDVRFEGIKTSMSEPFFALDTSDGCASNIGGFFEYDGNECGTNGGYNLGQSDKWRQAPSKKAAAEGEDVKCCIRKDIPNECENKGGICFIPPEDIPSTPNIDESSETPSLFPKDYGRKWLCPKVKQRCYVKENNMFSYTRYITEFGPKGGNAFFVPLRPGERIDLVDYTSDQIFAISFVSPAKQYCVSEDADAKCFLLMGLYVLGGAAGGVFIWPALPAIGAGALTSTSVMTVGAVGAGTYAADKVGVLDDLMRGVVEFFTGPITVEVPNFMLISSLNHAQGSGCAIV